MRTDDVIAVLRGKRTSGAMWLYLGAVFVLGGLVTFANALSALVTSKGDAEGLGSGALTVLVGAVLLAVPARLILQTVSIFADRVEWRRFPSVRVFAYADIVRVERGTRSIGIESFDEVFISLRDGSVHTISHLADGNDLVRAINTYGARRV